MANGLSIYAVKVGGSLLTRAASTSLFVINASLYVLSCLAPCAFLLLKFSCLHLFCFDYFFWRWKKKLSRSAKARPIPEEIELNCPIMHAAAF